MNERIQELKERAMVTNNRGDGYYDRILDDQKFAELIIQECADIADKNSPMSYPDHGIKIKRHFGVEL